MKPGKLGPFFDHNPAVLPSLFFLTGAAFAAYADPFLLLPFSLLSVPYIKRPKRLAVFWMLTILAFAYGRHGGERFPEGVPSLTGKGVFSVSDIKTKQNHFKKTTVAKGKLDFTDEETGKKAFNIPCSIPLTPSLRPLCSKKYLVEGTLKKQEGFFSFTRNKECFPEPTGPGSLLAERKFTVKKGMEKKIRGMYSDEKTAAFITAITLGDLEDSLLRFSFNKLGLQHILAISGFHFALLSLFIGGFLRLFLPKKAADIFLFSLLTLYFALLGHAPSVMRAYFGISLYLLGSLRNYRQSAVNLLAVALLLELIIAPGSVKNLGFQLSFLATGSILILFPVFFSLMQKIIPKRTVSESLSFSAPEKIVYLWICFLRSSLAVNLAVSVTIIPVCLFHFGSFPLLSIPYNLFIPTAVSLSLFIFLLGLPLMFIPEVARLIHAAGELFTSKILRIIIESPNCIRFTLHSGSISLPVLYLYLIGIFALFLSLNNSSRAKKYE